MNRPTDRAFDIAQQLRCHPSSPYFQHRKIALSTAMRAISPVVGEKGLLDMCGLQQSSHQLQVLLNYFNALKGRYKESWTDPLNVFQKANGFIGAMMFFSNQLIPFCVESGNNFREDHMASVLLVTGVIDSSEVVGRRGRQLIGHNFATKVAELLREKSMVPSRKPEI